MSDIYLQITETPTVVTLSAPVVSGALASTVTVANVVTVALDSNSLSALENVTVTVGAAITGTVTVSNFPASQAVTFSAVSISNFPVTQPVSIASVTVGNTVTIAGTVTANPTGTQTIAGTVTANVFGQSSSGQNVLPIPVNEAGNSDNLLRHIPIGFVDGNGESAIISSNSPLPISGTVTLGAGTAQIGSVTASISGTVPVSGTFFQGTQPVSLTTLPALVAGTAQIGSVTASISNSVTISANPSGALTTQFGSVTTANTAQITTAVTNTSRKYLFAQNISVGSVTMGIGFSPTTTQGIQLSAGSGIVFDSFCPTGAVYWLGATTGAAWSILEG